MNKIEVPTELEGEIPEPFLKAFEELVKDYPQNRIRWEISQSEFTTLEGSHSWDLYMRADCGRHEEGYYTTTHPRSLCRYYGFMDGSALNEEIVKKWPALLTELNTLFEKEEKERLDRINAM